MIFEKLRPGLENEEKWGQALMMTGSPDGIVKQRCVFSWWHDNFCSW